VPCSEEHSNPFFTSVSARDLTRMIKTESLDSMADELDHSAHAWNGSRRPRCFGLGRRIDQLIDPINLDWFTDMVDVPHSRLANRGSVRFPPKPSG